MNIDNFKELFISYLEKEDKKIYDFIEENQNLIKSINENKELQKDFIDNINNSIIHSIKNLDFVEGLLKSQKLKEIYTEFQSSDILIKICKSKKEDCIRYINWLLSMNVNVNLMDENDRTASMYLGLNGQVKALEILIRHGADINYVNPYNESVISIIIKEINSSAITVDDAKSILNVLSQFKCNFNIAVDKDENTAFMALLLLNTLFSPTDIINIAKKTGNIDFSIKNKYQESASSLLIKSNNQILIFNLIHNPTFDYNYRDKETGNNLIMISAISQANVLNDLLKVKQMKKRINDVNNNNENALIIATKGGCVDSVKLLLKHHINVNQQDNSGNTALHYAILLGDNYIVKMICAKKADYNIKNNKDMTPSMLASQTRNFEIRSIMSTPILNIERSKHNVSKIAYDKNKDTFKYLSPKTTIKYKDLDKELVFKNSNQTLYSLYIDKMQLLGEIAIGIL